MNPRPPPDVLLASSLFYGSMILLALFLAYLGEVPWPSWQVQGHWCAWALGSALVVCLLSYLAGARLLRVLVEEIQQVLGGIGKGEIVALASLSALGEEWLFRGVLQPWIGPVPATLLFGGLHFPYRPGLLPWTLFALVVGAWMAWLREASGSLIPPILFHGTVNAVNLTWILSIPSSECPEPSSDSSPSSSSPS